MYKDWSYWKDKAVDIANSFGIKYERVKSGYNKGQYIARLEFPSYVDNSENIWQERRKYLIEKVGFEIPSFSSISGIDQQDAKKYLIQTIANALSENNKFTQEQKISDKWDYYLKNQDNDSISFSGEVGRDILDYFNVLTGKINDANWQDKNKYEGELRYKIQNVNSFKELYYLAKQFAKNYHLKANEDLTRQLRNKSVENERKTVSTFDFDENNINEIKQFETQFSTATPEVKNNNNIEAIKGADLSKTSNTSFIKIGYRKDTFLSGNIFVGRERDIIFSNDEIQVGYFAVVELNDILASHNENNFANTENYPTDETGRNVNDRNYSGDKNAQAKVISVAQKLNPNIIISTSATASGTPIISVDGVVVSGNNRTMSLKIAYSKYPEIYEKYKKSLYAELESGGYGISMANIYPKFKQPVLVRFDLGVDEYTTSELNKYNKVRSKSEKPIDTAIRLSRQLSDNPNCQNQLIGLVSTQEVVSDIYNDRNSVVLLRKILLDCNIITENEISNLFSGNTLTNSGKILYETLLLSMVLQTDAIEISQNDGVKSATRSIVNAIIPCIKNKALSEGSLIDDINKALLIQNEMVNRGIIDLYEYTTQIELFEENPLINKKSVILNWYMNKSANLLKTTLTKYNNSIESNTGASIFGDSLTPDEIFKELFENGVDSKILTVFEKKQVTEKLLPLSNEKTQLIERIENLKLAKKYQSESDVVQIDELINKLELALKYI